jgi:AsmA family/AsmA-like C-terminal region
MSQTRRRYLRNAAVVLLLLIAAAWILPLFLNAGRYRPLLKAGLERSLHRNVALGHIALHFFPHLGFTVDNVVVDEDPAFGLEPFVRVDRIDCDLRWRSLWSSHLYFGTLKLSNPSINLVRNSEGRWNIENLLLQSGIKAQASGIARAEAAPANLAVEIEGARVNFKIGENKKPFAVVDARAHLDFDYGSDRVDFRMAGDPARTDMEYPTPGLVELDGSWSPARTSGHALDATLRMQGALLYDWIPLLTGKNPEVYGVMNSTIHLSGTLRQIKYSGESQLSQLHRWEKLPSSNDLPCVLRFRGQFDRDKEGLQISGMDLAFADSQIHLEGSIANITSRPDFDLVVAFERTQLQDLLRLGGRILGNQAAWKLTGRLNGMISVQGPWSGKRYGGFLNAQEVRLETTSGSFPVSDVAIRIVRSSIRLSPARVLLAPGVEVVAEGSLRHISPDQSTRHTTAHPAYELTLSSQTVNLSSLMHFGRALGLLRPGALEAEGIGSFTLHLAGGAWPWSRPSVTAQASVRSARVVVLGLSEKLNIPRARVQVYDNQIIINPILAVMGTSVFSGWVTHQRGSQFPWDFNLKADKLSIEQAAQWFAGTGDHTSSSFLGKFSSLSSLMGGHRASFPLAAHLEARGHFSTPLLTYRELALHDFKANIDIHDRKTNLAKITFEAGGGRGKGNALVDLTKTPVQFSGKAGIKRANVQAMASYLPADLNKAHGFFSASGSFQASGLSHAEIVRTLRSKVTVELEGVNLSNFDPVRVLGRRLGMDLIEAGTQPFFISRATAQLLVGDRQVTLENFPVDVAGAEFQLQGDYSFDGTARLLVRADLRDIRRPWTPVHRGNVGPVSRMVELHFAGTLRKLEMVPSGQISQTQP